MRKVSRFPFKQSFVALDKKDLSTGEKYRVGQLRIFVRKNFKKFGCRIPTLYIKNDSGLQESIYKFGNMPIMLVVNRGSLDNSGLDELKGCIGHEIGHVFAPRILQKCHPQTKYRCIIIGIWAFITLINLIIFSVFSSFLSYLNPFLYSILWTCLVLVFVKVNVLFFTHEINYNSIIINHNRKLEMISDEFGAKLVGSIDGEIKDIYQSHDYYLSQLEIPQMPPFPKPRGIRNNKAKQRIRKVIKSLENTKQNMVKIQAKENYHLWNDEDKQHPSDRTRVNNLRRFAKNGMKKW